MRSYSIPLDEYTIKSDLLNYAEWEAKKLLIGRLYILLADKKFGKYNTISFKVLIEEIRDDKLFKDKDKSSLECHLKKIKGLHKSYKLFRDKFFAHIELNDKNELRSINEFNFSDENIKDLMELAESIHKDIFFFLRNQTLVYYEKAIEKILREDVFKCYVNAGLIEKR